MTKQELDNKAELIFANKPNETTLYCIDNGNFWYGKDKYAAKKYADSLGKQLITISREEAKIETINEPNDKEIVKVVDEAIKNKPSKKKYNSKNKS